jgi:hypothetical protein
MLAIFCVGTIVFLGSVLLVNVSKSSPAATIGMIGALVGMLLVLAVGIWAIAYGVR